LIGTSMWQTGSTSVSGWRLKSGIFKATMSFP
jgi:hypothetical protein